MCNTTDATSEAINAYPPKHGDNVFLWNSFWTVLSAFCWVKLFFLSFYAIFLHCIVKITSTYFSCFFSINVLSSVVYFYRAFSICVRLKVTKRCVYINIYLLYLIAAFTFIIWHFAKQMDFDNLTILLYLLGIECFRLVSLSRQYFSYLFCMPHLDALCFLSMSPFVRPSASLSVCSPSFRLKFVVKVVFD